MPAIIPIERFEIFASGLDHPECLAFDRDGFLWAGGEAGQVYRIAPDGKFEQIATVGTFNAGLAFSPIDDALFVCNPANGIVRVERNGRHQVFASEAQGIDGQTQKIICANYGVFDSSGNYYVTDSGQWKKQNGWLLRFTPDGHGQAIAGPFGYANGLALSQNERTLYMVESNTNRVWRFELSSEGTVQSQKVLAENVGRFPDGLALEAQGNLLACCYASDDIHQISADGEVKLFAHDPWAILLSRPTNMAFGGEALRTLYVANLGRQTIVRARIF
jgi:gluconolactonase